jgi:hypothetical protein
MAVKMILQGGPLDGDEQLVLDLNTTPGYEMQFNIPNYQTFAPDGESVVGLGLVVVYSFLEAGPGPVVGDSWTSSSIYEFAGEFFVAPPGGVTPPSPMPLPPAVFMNVLSGMTINANAPSPGVQLAGVAGLEVAGTGTSIGSTTVFLVAETVMVIMPPSAQYAVSMSATAGMNISVPFVGIEAGYGSGAYGGNAYGLEPGAVITGYGSGLYGAGIYPGSGYGNGLYGTGNYGVI